MRFLRSESHREFGGVEADVDVEASVVRCRLVLFDRVVRV